MRDIDMKLTENKLRNIIREEIDDIKLGPSDETVSDWASYRYQQKMITDLYQEVEQLANRLQTTVDSMEDLKNKIEDDSFIEEYGEVKRLYEDFYESLKKLSLTLETNIYKRKGYEEHDQTRRARGYK